MRVLVIPSGLGVGLLLAELVACSTGTNGTGFGPDAGMGADAAIDSTEPVEAGPDVTSGPEAQSDVGADTSKRDAGDAAEGSSDSSADVSSDSSDAAAEAGPCFGVLCNGACLAASDCRSCAGAPLLCAVLGACVSSCNSCADVPGDASAPIECYTCDPNHQNPLGSCQPNDSSAYCLSGDYFGAYVDGSPGYACSCTDAGVSGCPGGNQVCAAEGLGMFCFSCGEVSAVTLDGLPCRDGGSCQSGNRTCN